MATTITIVVALTCSSDLSAKLILGRQSLGSVSTMKWMLNFTAKKIQTTISMDVLRFKLRMKSASFSIHRTEKKSTVHVSKRYCTSVVCSIRQAMDIKRSRTKGSDLTSSHRFESQRKRNLWWVCSRCRLQVSSLTLSEFPMASASKRKNSAEFQDLMLASGCPPQTDASTFDLGENMGNQALITAWNFLVGKYPLLKQARKA